MKLSPLNKFRAYFLINTAWYSFFILPVLLNDVTPFVLLIPVLFHVRIEHINQLEKHCYASSITNNPSITYTEEDTSTALKDYTISKGEVQGHPIVTQDKGTTFDYTIYQLDETNRFTPTRYFSGRREKGSIEASVLKHRPEDDESSTLQDDVTTKETERRRLQVKCICSDRTVGSSSE